MIRCYSRAANRIACRLMWGGCKGSWYFSLQTVQNPSTTTNLLFSILLFSSSLIRFASTLSSGRSSAPRVFPDRSFITLYDDDDFRRETNPARGVSATDDWYKRKKKKEKIRNRSRGRKNKISNKKYLSMYILYIYNYWKRKNQTRRGCIEKIMFCSIDSYTYHTPKQSPTLGFSRSPIFHSNDIKLMVRECIEQFLL